GVPPRPTYLGSRGFKVYVVLVGDVARKGEAGQYQLGYGRGSRDLGGFGEVGPGKTQSREDSVSGRLSLGKTQSRTVLGCNTKHHNVETNKKNQPVKGENSANNQNKEARIEHQLTTPYTRKQNGISERRNRSMMEMTRCMLQEKELLKTFWAEVKRNKLDKKAISSIFMGLQLNCTKKQEIIAQPITDVKFIAVTVSINQTTIAIANNRCVKHFNIKLYFLREIQQSGEVNLVNCNVVVIEWNNSLSSSHYTTNHILTIKPKNLLQAVKQERRETPGDFADKR
ncbi:hypothetical protein CR513_27437, partial [Mucuna pruriens]